MSAITVSDLEADPHPIYQWLRDHQPVAWVESVGLWLVTRWDDVRRVALDHANFTPALSNSPLNRTLGQTLMHAEDPYHAEIRAAIQAPFHPAEVRRHAAAGIAKIADDLIDQFVDRGAADLVAEYAEPLSVRVLQGALGLNASPEASLRRWFSDLATGGSNFEGDPGKQAIGDRASREVDALLRSLLVGDRPPAAGCMLANLAQATVQGRPLQLAEIAANIKLSILGGMQEPRDLIGLALLALADQPATLARVVADPALDKPLVEEALRWGSPVGTLTRETRREVDVAGVRLPIGARVAAVIASANRDERHWREPDRFDLDRREGPHLAFGLGDHFCLGAWLSRAEGAVGLRRLFARLPNLRFDDATSVVVRGWEFRGPVALRARWDAP